MHDPSACPPTSRTAGRPRSPDTEVHDAAGPANHWFYLIAERSNPGGGKLDSPHAEDLVLGVRRCCVATMNAVTQLFPGDCDTFDTVKGAWDAVSVPRQGNEPNRPSHCCTPVGEFSLGPAASGEVEAGASVSARASTTTVTGSPQEITPLPAACLRGPRHRSRRCR